MLARTSNKYLLACLPIFIGSSMLFTSQQRAITASLESPAYLRQVRAIATTDIGIPRPAGLAFSSVDNAFLTLEAQPQGQSKSMESQIKLFSLYADPLGALRVPAGFADPINMTFDAQANRLLLFDPTSSDLVAVQTAATGSSGSAFGTFTRFPSQRFGLIHPQGMTFDAQSGYLFILDASRRQIVYFTATSLAAREDTKTAGNNSMFHVDLASLGGVQLRGIAFNPQTRHLYLLSPAAQQLYELTLSGELLASRNLAPLGLSDLQGMVFAPSGDPTDEPTEMSLYLVDGGARATQPSISAYGQIIEVTLTQPPAALLPNSAAASLVRIIDTARWSPPSPDPSDIAYLPESQRLFISDGEVDEMPQYFTGNNLFESTRAGTLVSTYSTLSFSHEPAGATINPSNHHRFFSDDNGKKVFEVNLGLDGRFGTSDDIVTSFSTRMFGSVDPEGLAFGEGKLFIADGLGKEVYVVSPGANGIFEGVTSSSDDRVNHFDTSILGETDPEGVEFNPNTRTLYIVSNNGQNTSIAETTTTGTIVRVIDISFLKADSPSGLTYAPSSVNPAVMSLYITDRGVDNNVDPNENDGKVYEIRLDASSPPPTPVPSPTRTPKPSKHIYKRYIPAMRRG